MTLESDYFTIKLSVIKTHNTLIDRASERASDRPAPLLSISSKRPSNGENSRTGTLTIKNKIVYTSVIVHVAHNHIMLNTYGLHYS